MYNVSLHSSPSILISMTAVCPEASLCNQNIRLIISTFVTTSNNQSANHFMPLAAPRKVWYFATGIHYFSKNNLSYCIRQHFNNGLCLL